MKKRNKGFSLVEMLAVVAIIAILVALSTVGISRYRRSLALIEMDGLAKEIYVAAQNNLSQAYSQGYLGLTAGDNDDGHAYGTEDTDESVEGKDVYHYIVSSDYNFKSAAYADSILDLMLPVGTIDSTVLSQGSLIIRYQKSTGTVLDVYYAEGTGSSYAHNFTDDDYSVLIYDSDNNKNYRSESELRKNYGTDKAVIGYCGTYDKTVSGSSVDKIELLAPQVSGYNENKLYAVITFPDNNLTGYTEEKYITVNGEDGQKVIFKIDASGVVTRVAYDKTGKEIYETPTTFNLSDEGAQLSQVTDDNGQTMPGGITVPKGSYILILDDITTKNRHFADLYPENPEGWTPGEDVTIRAETKLTKNGAVTHSAKSNEVTLNSIFASCDNNNVVINNIRQLENLDPDVSGFNPDSKVIIDQKSDITFDKFIEELGENTEISKINGVDDPSDPGTFAPIDINYTFEYDGNDHTIENIVVKTEGDAGIFGQVSGAGSEIKDLKIVNPDIWSYEGNAGALAAYVAGGSKNYFKISGVIAYNARPVNAASDWTDADLRIHATWNAGGLIGRCYSYVSVTACGAAVYVESFPKDYDMENMSDDDTITCNAGGFVGRINKTNITGCFAGGHTVSGKYLSTYTGDGRVNVVGAKRSGGFVGFAKETNKIEYCYTTCSAGSGKSFTSYNSYVGGFGAAIDKETTLNYCYTVGRVVGTKLSRTYSFSYSSYSFSGSNNYFLDGVSVNVTQRDNNSVVSSVKIDSSNNEIISYESSRQNAYVYDDFLKVDSEGKYYFLTVDQLYEKAGKTGMSKTGITDVQYGDWQLPSATTAYVFFQNGDKLELWIEIATVMSDDLGDGEKYITVGFQGKTSGTSKVRTYLFDLNDIDTDGGSANETVSYTMGTASSTGDISWASGAGSPSKIKALPAVIDDSGKYLVLTLDDITQQNTHFYQLLGITETVNGVKLPALTPGEVITAYVTAGVASSTADLYASSSDTTNSLFEYNSVNSSGIMKVDDVSSNIMYISNIRHLQNIATDISGISNSRPGYVYICNDIIWGEPFSDGIYSKDGKTEFDGFRGIVYNTLKIFDGRGYTLENFKFANVCVSSKNFYSGLFQYITGSDTAVRTVEFKDLIILNPTVLADSSSKSGDNYIAYAGTLIAYVSGNVNLTVNNVAVIDNSNDSAETYAVTALGAVEGSGKSNYASAGGLIGYLSTSNGVTVLINNSSVTANIYANIPDNYDKNYAGGLIGKVYKGTLNISNSYVGGHTVDGAYSESVWNIYGVGIAGGFIGASQSGTKDVINISNSFVTASVSGSQAGSFIGCLQRPLILENVYTTAPVIKAQKTTTYNITRGALVGYISNTNYGKVAFNNVYYLPECYNTNKLTMDGQLIGKGYSSELVTGEVKEAYYDAVSGKITSDNVSENVSIRKQENVVTVTHAIDTVLIDAEKEYPFICWTTAPNETGVYSFTGDWALKGIEEAVSHIATFYYITGDAASGSLVAPGNNEKSYLSGSAADVIVPTMLGSNSGWKGQTWYIGSKITAESFNFTSWSQTATAITYKEKENGSTFTIPVEYTYADCSIVLVYKADGDSHSITFIYDNSGNNNYSNLNSANIVRGTAQIVTSLSKADAPGISIDGLTLVGWYSDKSCTNKLDLTSTEKLTEDVTAYAKLGKKYTITINYLYNDNGTLKKLITPSVKTYISTEETPTITLLDGASDVFLEAYTLDKLHKDSASGTVVSTTASGKTATFKPSGTADATYYAVYKTTNKTININYKAIFTFVHTDSNWNYSDTLSKTLTYPTSGTYNAKNAAALMNVEGVPFQDFFNAQKFSNSTLNWSDCYIITGYSLPSESDQYLRITVERRKFTLSADANTGAYIEPAEVEYGKPLYDLLKDAAITRKGYTFPADFNSRWKYYKLGDKSSSAKTLTTATTMPAYNTVLYANWQAGTSNYTVLFWFENANDTEYAYGGSLTKQGTTGTQISTDDWKTLSSLSSGGSSHVHSPSCYDGASSVAFTTEYEGDDGLCEDSDKYWVVNGKRLSESSNPDKVSNAADGLVYAFDYADGGTVKGIKIGDSWYIYNGSLSSGQKVSCTGNNTNWLTSDYKTYFTYSQAKSYLESSDSAGHETIDGNGTTVLNVYYSRNRYHFYVELDNGNYSHTHTAYTGSCYSLTCGISEHTHTEACLSCTATEHTHGTGCVYTCGITEHDHTSGCTCTQEVHTHTAACNHTHDNCTLTCAHQDGKAHPIGCYFSSYKLASSLSGDQKKVYDSLNSAVKSPKSGYEYYVKVDATCDDSELYFFYLSGTWYLIDDEKSFSKPSSYIEGSKVSNKKVYIYQSTVATELDCEHSHVDSCYSCGKTTSTIDCGKTAHTHSNSCCTIKYHVHSGSCCKITEHTHSDANGCYQNCNAVKHTHTSACYSLTCKYAECTASNGKKYAMILYAKYKQNICDEWNASVLSKISGAGQWYDSTYSWSNRKTNNYYSSSYYLSTIDIMPGQDLYFTYRTSSNTYSTLYYYLQTPGNAKTSTSTNINGYNFDLYKSAKIRGGSGYSFTFEEEFSQINAFTRYAFQVNGYDLELDVKNIEDYGVRSGRTVNLYYLRDSFTIEFWVDNAKYKSYSLQSDVVLDSYCTAASQTRPSYVPSDYVFSGWYLDKECTAEPYVAGSKMPETNYILYSKWLPPMKTVTFMVKDGNGVYQVYKTVDVRKYSTLEGIITDANNEYLSEYNPDNLSYWYYLENSSKKRFIPQKQITDNMTLYAEYADNSATSQVTVKYKYGSQIISTAETYNYTVGGLFAISSKTIEGYTIKGWKQGESGTLQGSASASITVSADATGNVIIFEYEEVKTWTLKVIYSIRYKTSRQNQTLQTTEGEVAIYEWSKLIKDNIATATYTLSQDDTKIVEFSLPAGYENYKFYSFVVDTAKKSGDYAGQITSRQYEYMTYNGQSTRTIIFLITPDEDTCKVSDLHATYDGNDKLGSISTASFTAPSFKHASVKFYFKNNSGTTAIHTGAYKITVYTVLTYAGHNFLIREDTVKLVIDPVTIKLKSGSATIDYSKSILKNETVTTMDGSDWKTAFCSPGGKSDSDYFEAVFTVDAFRMDAGVASNSFIMRVKDTVDTELAGKLADDYLIETEFGVLVVEWKYQVVYKFRYRSTVDTDTTTAMEWAISTGEVITSNEATVPVSIALDSKYTNCRLSYNYAGKDVDVVSKTAAVNVSPEVSQNYKNGYVSVLTVYIEPNVDLASGYLPSASESFTFDGKNHKLTVAADFNETLFNGYRPSDVSSVKLVLETTYYDAANTVMQSNPLNAGTYYTTTKLYLAVSRTVNKTTSTTRYLIASDTTKSITLTINPLAVTVTSPSSTAYIDENGNIVFTQKDVTISSTLLTKSMFTPVYSSNGSLRIGNNTKGNYFTLKWNTGVNSDNFIINRVYGDLKLSWRVKVYFWLRPDNSSVLTSAGFVNNSGVVFNQVGTAYLIKSSYIEIDTEEYTVVANEMKTLSGLTGYAIADDFLYNNVIFSFEEGSTISPNVNVYGEYRANELHMYMCPSISADTIAAAKIKPQTITLPSALEGVTSATARLYAKTYEIDNEKDRYALYTYVILEVKIITSSGTTVNNYLISYEMTTDR